MAPGNNKNIFKWLDCILQNKRVEFNQRLYDRFTIVMGFCPTLDEYNNRRQAFYRNIFYCQLCAEWVSKDDRFKNIINVEVVDCMSGIPSDENYFYKCGQKLGSWYFIMA